MPKGGGGTSITLPSETNIIPGSGKIRKNLVEMAFRALQGEDFGLQLEPMFTPQREALESQFGQAREQIIQQTPTRGGQLNRALEDVSLGRAGAVTGLAGESRQLGLNLATGMTLGALPSQVASSGQQLQLAAALAQSQAAQQAAQGSAKGGALGSLAALGTAALKRT